MRKPISNFTKSVLQKEGDCYKWEKMKLYHLPRITASDSREELGVICVFLFLHTERTSLPFGHPLQSSKCTFLCCKILMQNLVTSLFRVERHAAAYSATLLDVKLLSCISYKVNKTHFCTSTSFSFSYLT